LQENIFSSQGNITSGQNWLLPYFHCHSSKGEIANTGIKD